MPASVVDGSTGAQLEHKRNDDEERKSTSCHRQRRHSQRLSVRQHELSLPNTRARDDQEISGPMEEAQLGGEPVFDNRKVPAAQSRSSQRSNVTTSASSRSRRSTRSHITPKVQAAQLSAPRTNIARCKRERRVTVTRHPVKPRWNGFLREFLCDVILLTVLTPTTASASIIYLCIVQQKVVLHSLPWYHVIPMSIFGILWLFISWRMLKLGFQCKKKINRSVRAEKRRREQELELETLIREIARKNNIELDRNKHHQQELHQPQISSTIQHFYQFETRIRLEDYCDPRNGKEIVV